MILREDWEFNVLGIYNYRKPGQLGGYFDYINEHHDHIEGDIVEAGVYKGRSLLAAGLLLKELGSAKQVFGFDSFQGFPAIHHENDDLSKFDELLAEGRISEAHHEKVKRNERFRSFAVGGELSSANISLSGDFSENSMDEVKKKIDFLGLDNVHLVPGQFTETMGDTQRYPAMIMAASLDCDLYSSYTAALPFVWPRLSRGGYIWLDEYYSLKFPGARIASDKYFSGKAVKPQMHKLWAGDFERWYVRKPHDD